MAWKGRRGRAAAFTLIELLVVIAIIMILAAMSAPVLVKAQVTARRALCVSNLREVGKALYMYSNDFDGVFPSKYNVGGGDDLSALHPSYAPELTVFGCPARKPPPSSVEHITRKCIGATGETGPYMTYEYYGEYDFGLHHGDINTRLALVMHDEDDWGLNGVLSRADNHGAAGGNILFLDNRVLWIKAPVWLATRGAGKGEWIRVGHN